MTPRRRAAQDGEADRGGGDEERGAEAEPERYPVGEILVCAHSGRERAGSRDTIFSGPHPSLGGLDPSRQPHLVAIGDQWPVLAARDTYPQGLEALVDGLLAQARSDTQ